MSESTILNFLFTPLEIINAPPNVRVGSVHLDEAMKKNLWDGLLDDLKPSLAGQRHTSTFALVQISTCYHQRQDFASSGVDNVRRSRFFLGHCCCCFRGFAILVVDATAAADSATINHFVPNTVKNGSVAAVTNRRIHRGEGGGRIHVGDVLGDEGWQVREEKLL